MRRGATAVLALAFALGCGREGGAPPREEPLADGVLAEVGPQRLTGADLERLVPPEFRDEMTGAEIRDVVDRWVRTELLYQKAVRDELERDARIQERLRDLQRELLADEMLQRELDRRVRIGSDEVLAHYQANLAQYTQELHVQHIVLNTREEAEQILQQLQGGADFAALAKQHSIDETASRGGDLGFLDRHAMNPAFPPVVFALDANQVTGPIVTGFGFHVVRIAARREAEDPESFEAVRDEILHTLLLARQQRAREELLQELRASVPVRIATSYAGMALEPANSMPEPRAPAIDLPPLPETDPDTLGQP